MGLKCGSEHVDIFIIFQRASKSVMHLWLDLKVLTDLVDSAILTPLSPGPWLLTASPAVLVSVETQRQTHAHLT